MFTIQVKDLKLTPQLYRSSCLLFRFALKCQHTDKSLNPRVLYGQNTSITHICLSILHVGAIKIRDNADLLEYVFTCVLI